MTDRWQKFTEECINEKQLDELSKYCDEFLIHGVDAEGKSGGKMDFTIGSALDLFGGKLPYNEIKNIK